MESQIFRQLVVDYNPKGDHNIKCNGDIGGFLFKSDLLEVIGHPQKIAISDGDYYGIVNQP